MKIDRLETHDRFLEFLKQSDFISKGCSDCMKNRPAQFTMPFYIFAHCRTIGMDERISIFEVDQMSARLDPLYTKQYASFDQVPTARFIWCPRLTKPIPQPNSMLFKAYPPSDNIKVIWILPAQELWDQYEKGLMLENKIVKKSIEAFKNDFAILSQAESDDLPLTRVKEIYQDIQKHIQKKE